MFFFIHLLFCWRRIIARWCSGSNFLGAARQWRRSRAARAPYGQQRATTTNVNIAKTNIFTYYYECINKIIIAIHELNTFLQDKFDVKTELFLKREIKRNKRLLRRQKEIQWEKRYVKNIFMISNELNLFYVFTEFNQNSLNLEVAFIFIQSNLVEV